MRIEERTGTVHGSSFAVVLPDGWWQSERRTFTSPTGTQVHVDVAPVPVGADPDELVRTRLDGIGAALALVGERRLTSISLPGHREGTEARLTFREGDTDWDARIVGWSEQHRTVAVSTVVPAGGSTDADLERVVAGLRVATALSASAGADAPVEPSERPAADWVRLAERWSSTPPGVAERTHASHWTADELQVCASILGRDDMAAFGDSVIAAADDDVRRAVVVAVTRSLLARGLVETAEDGSVHLAAPAATPVEVALRPDLGVSVERIGPERTGSWWFGLRPDAAAQLTLLADGFRDVALLDPELAIAHAMALGGLTGDESGVSTPDGSAVDETIVVSAADVVAGHETLAEVVRLAATWRDAGAVHGAVHAWAIGHDGGIWLADDAADVAASWTMRRSDHGAVRRAIVADLPGRALRSS